MVFVDLMVKRSPVKALIEGSTPFKHPKIGRLAEWLIVSSWKGDEGLKLLHRFKSCIFHLDIGRVAECAPPERGVALNRAQRFESFMSILN
jgi:hypothetical protein